MLYPLAPVTADQLMVLYALLVRVVAPVAVDTTADDDVSPPLSRAVTE